MSQRTDDESALLLDIRLALRGLDPWSLKGNRVLSEDYARKVLAHLKLWGWDIHRPLPKALHRNVTLAIRETKRQFRAVKTTANASSRRLEGSCK
jgi:hypothetical protein